ncbi:Uncharacterised protein [Metamycoplasma arthritidis]|uniref:Hypothetical membrane protein n=1 Tax=Metamycoplasma arthritidis (strain 158L3-1) TaxID=243272 RepID=B3PMJ6_META1|nr:hypothetical protein [Metamycoplasma arthritidis]ACF07248.1 hypothetical membrane protein [Metamycoplasma arthritidis 158L3-1]VEU78772.1 Uncharacterised protein [Metamycoplasma arthritidis]
MVITRKKRILMISLTSATVLAAGLGTISVFVYNKNKQTRYENMINNNYNMAESYSYQLSEFEKEIDNLENAPMNKWEEFFEEINKKLAAAQEFIKLSHSIENEDRLKVVYEKLKYKIIEIKARIVKANSKVNDFKRDFDKRYLVLYDEFQKFAKQLSRRDITTKELISALESSREFLDNLAKEWEIAQSKEYRFSEVNKLKSNVQKIVDNVHEFNNKTWKFIPEVEKKMGVINKIRFAQKWDFNKNLKIKTFETYLTNLQIRIDDLSNFYDANKVEKGLEIEETLKKVENFLKTINDEKTQLKRDFETAKATFLQGLEASLKQMQNDYKDIASGFSEIKKHKDSPNDSSWSEISRLKELIYSLNKSVEAALEHAKVHDYYDKDKILSQIKSNLTAISQEIEKHFHSDIK